MTVLPETSVKLAEKSISQIAQIVSNISKLLVNSLLEGPQVLIKVTELHVKAVLEGVPDLGADVSHLIPGHHHSVLQIISQLFKSKKIFKFSLRSDIFQYLEPIWCPTVSR